MAKEATKPKKRLYQNLTVQVLTAVTIGVLLGHFNPKLAIQMKPLGELFIKMIKMVIAPIVFCTIVVGIASMGDLKKVGRVGGKALLYFEVVTTIALAIGLFVANTVKPGAGINVAALAKGSVTKYAAAASEKTTWDFILNIVPDNVINAFAQGDMLQVLFFSVLFGIAITAMREKGKPLIEFFDKTSHALFGVVNIVMRFAPIGAFGAMSFTIGKYGLKSMIPLGKLMGSVYLTMFLFIFVILNAIAKYYGFSLWKFLKYIKEEILIVLGTSSSESALPRMMEKMEKFGCSKSVVGMVIPTGYSFNLDGTSIYLSMAAIFIAQAFNVDLSLGQQLSILGILMLTSKGAAAVTGGGFVTLAATLSATHVLPVEGLALLLGVDRFMSEARAITNLIGNGVATVVVAKMEKEFDEVQSAECQNSCLENMDVCLDKMTDSTIADPVVNN